MILGVVHVHLGAASWCALKHTHNFSYLQCCWTSSLSISICLFHIDVVVLTQG